MDVFAVRDSVIDDYRSFTTASIDIKDPRLKQFYDDELNRNRQWPEPWISLNPAFEPGGRIDELVAVGLLDPECDRIFRVKRHVEDRGTEPITLHRHQRDALEVAAKGYSYVLTTGTGSGKSLAYIVPIVDHVLRHPRTPGVKAIIVYPMNALANSQLGELEKFLINGYGQGKEPVTFARYTGQESNEERERILRNPPDILLTNYVMLELVLTRPDERTKLVKAAKGLQFLVLDELHTYRGRQGADVALLVRRLREACSAPELQCIGTSATMASGGSIRSQQSIVADVATRIFGTTVLPEHVIGETLTRATVANDGDAAALTAFIHSGTQPSGYEELAASPLAAWIESTFGLREEPGSDRLIRQTPQRLVEHAAPLLSEITGVPVAECDEAIRDMLLRGSTVRHPKTGRPLFAFRLHQFLSKGDTLYVSLESEQDRHITSKYQVAVPSSPEKLLYPLAFCRECGQDYAVVKATVSHGETEFAPRSSRDVAEDDAQDGYLYISSDFPWPADPIADGRLPDSWIDEHNQILANRVKYLPQRVRVDTSGHRVDTGGVEAAFVPAPFRFCLSCLVSYEQTRGRDFSKLVTLDAEGRSSAVSLLSSSLVSRLRQVPGDSLAAEARKLLTFVDNRQDASLQAGHLNDYVLVGQLRHALFAAMERHGRLTHESVAEHVVEALDLDFAQYAAAPDAKYEARNQTERALRELIEYRLYVDLQRGWRITMPNLEQTGLLRIDYQSLEEIAADDELWAKSHHALSDDSPDHRVELCRIVMDEFRRSLAIDVQCLTVDGFERIKRLSSQHLVGTWVVPDSEQMAEVGTVYPFPGTKGQARGRVHMTGRSALGRYLRQAREFPHYDGNLTTDDAQDIIIDILSVLHRTGLLIETEHERGMRGYRLKASAIIWKKGDGVSAAPDPIRKVVAAETGGRVNSFFRELYRGAAAELTGLMAREHTAQVPARQREDRERAFRKGSLPLLYCSPTMELGVDISSLNAVQMRNVPPTPANYAQRSGRAGRSGQPALVLTYCATGNAHDQYYFRRSRDMVAGSVEAPRLDLANETLLKSHMQAVWLAETGESLGSSLTDLLIMEGDPPSLEMRPELATAFADPDAIRRAIIHAKAIVEPMLDELREAAWWNEDWVENVVRKAPEALNRACDRWRNLYRGALADQEAQNRIVLESAQSPKARIAAQARRREAENQLRLLRNEDRDHGHSDFYSYRYFASEGFLPGYSFPRLPLAAYVPPMRSAGGYEGGDYIQRPRFLAISEFGPNALIYHEGARYEVDRIQVPLAAGSASVDLSEARQCADCGYHHDRRPGLDVCEHCGETLGATTSGLMELTTVYTRRRERISSDEEERRRAGFELQTSFRFSDHGSRAGKLVAEIVDGDGSIAELAYGDSADVRITNLGRRRRKDRNIRGFYLDPVKGRWLTETRGDEILSAADDGNEPDLMGAMRVIPYVRDRRNILVLRLAQNVAEEVAITLRYALERGIEAAFQLEDSELVSEALPDPQHRGRMLFMESAEGGAGVLRRLQAEPDALALAARTALAIAHFDPETGEDCAGDDRDRCEKACYDCLLSYGNQYEHPMIDRHQVRDLLLRIARSATQSSASDVPRDAHAEQLMAASDTELERRWVRMLLAGGYRLPDVAQPVIEVAGTRPDFGFSPDVVIFIDGPVHSRDDKAAADRAAEQRLLEAGYDVIRFAHDEDWAAILREHADVFGKGHLV